MLTMEITGLQDGTWTHEVGPSINDPVADQYRIVQADGALNLVMCNSKAYAGWLAKNVHKLPVHARKISFRYTMMIDDCTTKCAQVAETDFKVTDKDRWTYDLSAQWLMRKEGVAPNWMFQIDNASWTWTDTGIVIPPFRTYEEYEVVIDGDIDYVSHKSAVTGVTVDGEYFIVPADKQWIPARQEGWAPNEIVTQLQQCNNSQPGGYTLRFPEIGYTLEEW